MTKNKYERAIRKAQESDASLDWPKPEFGHGNATGAAKQLAREHKLCVQLLEGSGQNEKVLKRDVQEAIEELREKLTSNE